MMSKDADLTKAHARCLECRFISVALIANRAKLPNSTTPPPTRSGGAESVPEPASFQQVK